MRLFKWSSAQQIFVAEIDAEHRNLFRSGDALQKAMLAGAEPELIATLLRSVMEESEAHFRHEERMMREAAFPSLAWHKGQHDAVRHRAQDYAERIQAGDKEAQVELLTFLSSWLLDHIAVADRMMGAYLRNYRRRERALAS